MTNWNFRHSTLNRRRVLQGLAGGVAATGAMALFGPVVRAATKSIKIGYVSPRSGPLAAFAEADDFVLGEFRKFAEDGIGWDRKPTPSRSSPRTAQSNPNRAAEVAKELITRDNVSLIVVAATRRPTIRSRPSANSNRFLHFQRRAVADQFHWPPGQSRRSEKLEAVRLHVPLLLGPGGRHRRLHRHVEPGVDQQISRRAISQ